MSHLLVFMCLQILCTCIKYGISPYVGVGVGVCVGMGVGVGVVSALTYLMGTVVIFDLEMLQTCCDVSTAIVG